MKSRTKQFTTLTALFWIFSLLPTGLTWAGVEIPIPSAQDIKNVVLIVLENTAYTTAMNIPYFKEIAKKGALLTRFTATTHPSQPNYIALIAGETFGVRNGNETLKGRHLGDLLQDKQLSWKTYAENFPGGCFLGSRASGGYVRRHNPFISFASVQKSELCQQIQNADQFDVDWTTHKLPTFSLYVPNLDNDGHDTSAEFAGTWLSQKFGKYLQDKEMMKSVLIIVTFDEDHYDTQDNHILTIFLGAGVQVGARSNQAYNHYSLLVTLEAIFGLKSLGKGDAQAALITDIWKPKKVAN